jgi:release factor glutamine methyltransferase
MADWTVKKLLDWITKYLDEKGVDSARLCAELLLGHVLGLERIHLYTNFDKPVSQSDLDQLHSLVKRAGNQEPVQYLVGKTEFYSMEIEVSTNCLIPRPETELLVEYAIEFLRSRQGPQLVCDLCTGSGCIAVAIAKNHPETKIIGTDICDKALTMADTNVKKHNLSDQIELLCGDLFEPLVPQLDKAKFDLVVSNPPYVSTKEYEKLDKNIKEYEPSHALLAGVEGLDYYQKICSKIGEFLKGDSAVIIEIGYTQGQEVKDLIHNTGLFAEVQIIQDIHSHDRIVVAKCGSDRSSGRL